MKTQVKVLAVLLMMVVVFVGQTSGQEMGRYIVTIEGPAGPAVDAVIRAGGIPDHVYDIIEAIAIRIPDAALPGFSRNPFVVSVEPDIMVYAIDTELDNTWGVKRIGAGTVHDTGNKGTGVKVAIIDSGIDYTHPDLDGNYVRGYDFVNEDTDPMDDYGHGTHVAGTVGAEDDGVGVVGVAPEAALYALKVLDAGGSGYYSDVIAALDWAVTNGIEVTNNSYGSTGDPGEAVKAAFDKAESAGILNVCSAGNNGNPPGMGDNVGYPARYESCIAVAATDDSDSRAKWSSTGPDLDISAPGVSINSTLLGGGYGTKSGTSMACPHVAGTLALNLQYSIFETADDLGPSGWDSKYGWGLVNAAAAAGVPEEPGNYPPTVTITSPADGDTFDSGASILFEGTASDTEDGDLTASLVWTSDIDGQIGTGGSFSTTLTDGNHTITASVTDSGGKTGSDSISITVGTPPAEPTVSVDSITYSTEGGKDGKKHLNIIVALVDDLGGSVGGASISIDTYRGETLYATGTGTTGTDGTVTYRLNNAPSGTYTTTVTNVTAAGLTWDGITPPNEFTK